jgi:hypothetical protein
MYEKREILWGQWTKTKTQQFSQHADVLENQLAEMEEIIAKADRNLFTEIKKYIENFDNDFSAWCEKLTEWKDPKHLDSSIHYATSTH